jgi:hypothetical protein
MWELRRWYSMTGKCIVIFLASKMTLWYKPKKFTASLQGHPVNYDCPERNLSFLVVATLAAEKSVSIDCTKSCCCKSEKSEGVVILICERSARATDICPFTVSRTIREYKKSRNAATADGRGSYLLPLYVSFKHNGFSRKKNFHSEHTFGTNVSSITLSLQQRMIILPIYTNTITSLSL